MISKAVSIEVAALGRTATEAQVVGVVGSVVVFDLYDADGIVAAGRYCTLASAPFKLTQGEVDTLTQPEPSRPSLADCKTSAIAGTYADVDGLYALAIGNRGAEYQKAEAQARAYAAAGYTGTPSEYITAYAVSNATGEVQTNQWSADAIIARADALDAAQVALRSQRFASQAAIRAAADYAALDAAVAEWSAFVQTIRAALAL